MKSKCHNAEMRVVGDTTKHYVCTECEEPCDAVSAFEVVGTQTLEEQVEEILKTMGYAEFEPMRGDHQKQDWRSYLTQALRTTQKNCDHLWLETIDEVLGSDEALKVKEALTNITKPS